MALLVLAFRADEPLAPPSRHRIDTAAETTVGRGSARSVERRADRDLVLRVADARMSSTHFVIRRSEQGFVVRDQGSRNGTLRNGEVVAEAALEDGDVLEAGRTFFVFRELEEKGDALLRPDDGPGRVALPVLATMAVPLAEVFRSVERVASSKLTVLLEAESGTGKELVARAVHALSGRKGPFVAVNCGAIPSNLVETELFGYRKGAFSGANEDRPGLVRSAAGGTLFLDELGDLPLAAQSAFLRLLQEREVTPVGDHRAVPVDVRVVTATHRHLASAAERGTFRADLLARLAGFTVHLPALRERREDLGLLTAAFLGRFASDPAVAVSFTLAAARALFAHAWPLNVREVHRTGPRHRRGQAARPRAFSGAHRRAGRVRTLLGSGSGRRLVRIAPASVDGGRAETPRSAARSPPSALGQHQRRRAGHGQGKKPDPAVDPALWHLPRRLGRGRVRTPVVERRRTDVADGDRSDTSPRRRPRRRLMRAGTCLGRLRDTIE